VTFTSGYLAGIFCAIVSHPADTIVSKMYFMPSKKKHNIGKAVQQIYHDIGWKGLWRGILPRIFMIGTLTGF